MITYEMLAVYDVNGDMVVNPEDFPTEPEHFDSLDNYYILLD
jgi:hypothetical protein